MFMLQKNCILISTFWISYNDNSLIFNSRKLIKFLVGCKVDVSSNIKILTLSTMLPSLRSEVKLCFHKLFSSNRNNSSIEIKHFSSFQQKINMFSVCFSGSKIVQMLNCIHKSIQFNIKQHCSLPLYLSMNAKLSRNLVLVSGAATILF